MVREQPRTPLNEFSTSFFSVIAATRMIVDDRRCFDSSPDANGSYISSRPMTTYLQAKRYVHTNLNALDTHKPQPDP